ncbi:MAG: ATP-binding protein [Bacteroidales bacterium]|nr:ATP-binding protein [Bacteroidales bacterium]
MRFERLAIRIPSGIKHIHLVERFLEEICDRYNIGMDYYGNITAAVMEAVENSIIHGNKMDEGKMIDILFEAKPGKLIFKIQDEGEGFPYLEVTDPTDTSISASDLQGRGLFIIRHLADEVHFNEKGNCIKLHFSISGIREEVNQDRRKKMASFKQSTRRSTHEKNR